MIIAPIIQLTAYLLTQVTCIIKMLEFACKIHSMRWPHWVSLQRSPRPLAGFGEVKERKVYKMKRRRSGLDIQKRTKGKRAPVIGS